MEQAVREDNARAAPVIISESDCRGFFIPTDRKSLDGRVVYLKCGDGSMCIEHLHGMWQVKSVKDMCKNTREVFSPGGCALDACVSRQWFFKNAEISGYRKSRSGKHLVTQDNVNSATDLSFADCNVGPKGAARLADFLSRSPLLSKLDLSGNNLTAAEIAACLTQLPSISNIILRNNKLGFDGAKTIITLTHLTRLTSLDLGSNELTADDGARICAAAVTAGMSGLKGLYLHGSTASDNLSAPDIVGSVAWRQMKLPQPPDEIVRRCTDQQSACNVAPLVSYLMSEDKVPCHAIRIFIVGESTVASLFILVFFCFSCSACMMLTNTLHFFLDFLLLCFSYCIESLVYCKRDIMLCCRWARLLSSGRSCHHHVFAIL